MGKDRGPEDGEGTVLLAAELAPVTEGADSPAPIDPGGAVETEAEAAAAAAAIAAARVARGGDRLASAGAPPLAVGGIGRGSRCCCCMLAFRADQLRLCHVTEQA